jgi:outer membrane protein OmpA-like peptidoglycan-associated protein
MKRESSMKSLAPAFAVACAVIAGLGAQLVSATAAAQAGPEDEPMPPALPDTPPPPPAAQPAPPPSSSATSAPSPASVPSAPPAVLEAPAAALGSSPDDTLVAAAPPRSSAVWDGPGSSYLPSLAGAIGLYRISTAEVGSVNHLRLALHGEFFQSSGFLVEGDRNSRLLGDFTFGFTPHKSIEVFGALLTSSNRNRRGTTAMPEANRRDPELIKSFGDLVLGGKGQLPIARGATVGFEMGLKFLSSVSDLSFSPSSTSIWFGPVFTLDLRHFGAGGTPLRFHVNANYYIDNSDNLHDFTDTTIYTREVATFAYGIAASRFRSGLGIDAPLDKVIPGLPLQPFAEYHAEIVTSGADPAFSDYMPPACGRSPATPCKYNRDQHWVSLGLRARVYKGLTLDAGVDLALRSAGFAYGTPLPPYNVIFGMSFPLDVEAFARPVVVTRTIEKPVPAAPAINEGKVAGVVKSSRGAAPIAGAIVMVTGRPRSRVATDPDGSFESVGLPPGPAELEVSAPGYEATKVTAAVSPAKPVELNVTLIPKTPTGNVRGKVADDRGRGIEASLKFLGPDNFEAKSDSAGLFSAALPAGPYKVMAEAPGFPTKEAQLEILAAQDKQMDFVLKNRAPSPDVTVSGNGIVLKKPIKFRSGGSPSLDAKWEAELDGVADVLEEHADVKALRVEAHWDSSAGAGAKPITQKQADLIKQYLMKKGVSDARVEAVGMGADRPLVPNISPANKAKNRRVDLRLLK